MFRVAGRPQLHPGVRRAVGVLAGCLTLGALLARTTAAAPSDTGWEAGRAALHPRLSVPERPDGDGERAANGRLDFPQALQPLVCPQGRLTVSLLPARPRQMEAARPTMNGGPAWWQSRLKAAGHTETASEAQPPSGGFPNRQAPRLRGDARSPPRTGLFVNFHYSPQERPKVRLRGLIRRAEFTVIAVQ
jgi:hypothetical protein